MNDLLKARLINQIKIFLVFLAGYVVSKGWATDDQVSKLPYLEISAAIVVWLFAHVQDWREKRKINALLIGAYLVDPGDAWQRVKAYARMVRDGTIRASTPQEHAATEVENRAGK